MNDLIESLKSGADYFNDRMRAAAEIERLTRELAKALVALREIRDQSCGCDAEWTNCPSCIARRALATADQPTAAPALCGPFPPVSEDEYTLRYLLAMHYVGEGLYGDDGELQLGGFPHPIDFRRDSVPEIRRKLEARGMAKLAAQLIADKPPDQPPPRNESAIELLKGWLADRSDEADQRVSLAQWLADRNADQPADVDDGGPYFGLQPTEVTCTCGTTSSQADLVGRDLNCPRHGMPADKSSAE